MMAPLPRLGEPGGAGCRAADALGVGRRARAGPLAAAAAGAGVQDRKNGKRQRLGRCRTGAA
jgi:hypothetical protein